MKILHVGLYNSKYGMGGAEQMIFELACTMKDDYGDEAACAVNPGDLTEKLKEKGIQVTPIYWSKAWTLQTLLQLRRILSSFRPDLIHSHHRFTTFLLDLFFKKKYKVLHTQYVPTYDRRRIFRYGHFVATTHESVRQNLIEVYRVPANRILAIRSGIRPLKPDQGKMARLRKKFPEASDKFRLLFIGRLEEQKGHIYLIEAVQKLASSYRQRLRIFLAGEGSLREDLKNRIRKAGLEDVFIFLGYSIEIPELLSWCDALILPSLWEATPLCILEAYSVGRPVIASDVPGTEGLVKPEETGLLVTPRDGEGLARVLAQAMDYPEKIETMGKKAFQWWSGEFARDVMIVRYRKLYEDLIGL